MKTIPAGLEAHLQQAVTTICSCWEITRTDGAVKRYTDHDKDLDVAGVIYYSTVNYASSANKSANDFSIDSVEVVSILSADDITRQDVLIGLYDDAKINIFKVNWANTADGTLQLRSGNIGEITLKDNIFICELRGLKHKLSRVFGDMYSPLCRADLGDTKCGFNVTAWAVDTTITAVVDAYTFDAATLNHADGWFEYGSATFNSGNNAGVEIEVRAQIGDRVFLYVGPQLEMQVGDTLTMLPGCSKQIAICNSKFNNVLNFRGEPYVPGTEQILLPGRNA